MYADDTDNLRKWYIQARNWSHNLNDVLKKCMIGLQKTNFLMNLKKTKVMMIGTKQRCSNYQIQTLTCEIKQCYRRLC